MVFSMESQTTKTETLSLPKDRSLEAYKAWVLEIATRLTKEDTKIKFTEEDWTAYWKEYWKERSSN